MTTGFDRRARSSEAWRRALEMTAQIPAHPEVTLPAIIVDRAGKFGAAPALLSEQQVLTYRDFNARANRYGRWALAHGLARGGVMCLLMANCPEYLSIWLGVTRVGGIVALVNTSLRGASLEHAVRLAEPSHIIVASELVDTLAAILPRLSPNLRCWVHGGASYDMPWIENEISSYQSADIDASECPPPTVGDLALYLYTSGTTGLPKAAPISHFRLMQWSHWFAGMTAAATTDVMYDCLPMYHSVGGIIAPGAMLVAGGSVVVRDRFSVSRFWDDVVHHECTMFQYIGELCRYLAAAPPHPREREHRLRLCCGNGMRGEVWKSLQQRFGIPEVIEFYAATEANFSLFNCDGEPGAIGRIPPFLAHRLPTALVRLQPETAEPLRDRDGLCIRCGTDEVGEAIGKIPDDRSQLSGRFEGYTDAEASARKILRNVFVRGDAWYRSGDLMRKDRRGYFYFIDRIGDTFRWKGENVSTMEVADMIARCPGVLEVVVCGVTLPGTEGRAGLAAIVIDATFDLARLHAHLGASLPDHAWPLFLRIRSEIEVTGTFKPQKQRIAEEGYDPATITDALYFNDRRSSAFVPLGLALYHALQSGTVRP
jgi:fatty-acyl-CoA synthase